MVMLPYTRQKKKKANCRQFMTKIGRNSMCFLTRKSEQRARRRRPQAAPVK